MQINVTSCNPYDVVHAVCVGEYNAYQCTCSKSDTSNERNFLTSIYSLYKGGEAINQFLANLVTDNALEDFDDDVDITPTKSDELTKREAQALSNVTRENDVDVSNTVRQSCFGSKAYASWASILRINFICNMSTVQIFTEDSYEYLYNNIIKAGSIIAKIHNYKYSCEKVYIKTHNRNYLQLSVFRMLMCLFRKLHYCPIDSNRVFLSNWQGTTGVSELNIFDCVFVNGYGTVCTPVRGFIIETILDKAMKQCIKSVNIALEYTKLYPDLAARAMTCVIEPTILTYDNVLATIGGSFLEEISKMLLCQSLKRCQMPYMSGNFYEILMCPLEVSLLLNQIILRIHSAISDCSFTDCQSQSLNYLQPFNALQIYSNCIPYGYAHHMNLLTVSSGYT